MGRGSIARLMTAIGLSSITLVSFRGWAGPDNWYGFLGLLALVVVAAWIAWIATFGVLRRFCGGFGATGIMLWVSVAIAPGSILDFCRDLLILPIHRWAQVGPQSGNFNLEFEFLWAELSENFTLGANPTPVDWLELRADLYRGYPKLQGLLLIPMAVLATFGGLIAAWFRPGRPRPSSPTPHP